MITVVAILVINPAGDLLLAERVGSGVTEFAGLWDTPGGKLHDGEDIWDAAQREMQEETGLSLHKSLFEYRGRSDLWNEAGAILDLHYWLVQLQDCEEGLPFQREPDKHGPWTWKTRAWMKENPRLVMPSLRSPDILDRCMAHKRSYTHPYCFGCGQMFPLTTEGCQECQRRSVAGCMSCQKTVPKDECRMVELTYTPRDTHKAPIKFPARLCAACQEKYGCGDLA